MNTLKPLTLLLLQDAQTGMKNLLCITTLVLVTVLHAQAQFVGPAPMVVPGDNYAFAYSTDGTVSGLTNFGLYFDETGATPGYQFMNGSGAKLVNIQSITKGNREPGDITFGATGSLIINPNRYAFRFSLTNSYGLFFNAAGFAYEFRTADASPVFSIGANSGDLAFDGTATIGLVPQDNALTEVLVKDSAGLVHYRDVATLGGLWATGGSDIYYNSGKVAIGSNAASHKLTLYSTGFNEKPLRLERTSTGSESSILHTTNGVDNWAIGMNNGSSNNYQIYSYSINDFAMTIQPNGRVGIGTETPTATLELRGSSPYIEISNDYETEAGIIFNDAQSPSTQNASINFNSSDNKLRFDIDYGTSMTIEPGGFVGLGTTNPDRRLDVNGDMRVTGSIYATSNGTNRYIRIINYQAANGAVIEPHSTNFGALGSANPYWDDASISEIWRDSEFTLSDSRLKKNVITLTGALDAIKELRGVSYDIRTELHPFYKNPKPDELAYADGRMGFIAQELEQVFPKMVIYDEDRGYLTVRNYEQLLPVLVEAIKEQQIQIEQLSNGPAGSPVSDQELIDLRQHMAEQGALNRELINKLQSQEQAIKALSDKLSQIDHSLDDCCSSHQQGTHRGMVEEPSLGQNIPNPFNRSTIIPFYLPEGVEKAIIQIADSQGKLVNEYDIVERGAGNVEFSPAQSATGSYVYSLIVDGKLMETKKMTSTK